MRRQTVLFTALVLASVAKLQPVEPIVVIGHSMEPTFDNHQCVLATRSFDKIRRGDIVVFKVHGEELMKRVTYLPGDRIKEYRNGPHWVTPATRLQEADFERAYRKTRTTILPEGKIYVMGDNFDDSIDSRDFGLVDIGSVRAKVLNCDGDGPMAVPVAARLARTYSVPA